MKTYMKKLQSRRVLLAKYLMLIFFISTLVTYESKLSGPHHCRWLLSQSAQHPVVNLLLA